MIRNLIARIVILRNRLLYAMRQRCRDILPPTSFQHTVGAMPCMPTCLPAVSSTSDEA